MFKVLMSLWLLMIFATPPTKNYAYRCDWRAGHLQEPSDAPYLCTNDMQDSAILPDFPECQGCRAACDMGQIPTPGNTTLAQVVSHTADQWDYG